MSETLTSSAGKQVSFFRCPNCGDGLDRTDSALVCPGCTREVAIIDGIAHFSEDRGELIAGLDYSKPDWQLRERELENEYEQNGVFTHGWLRSLPFPTEEAPSTFECKNGALGKNFLSVLGTLNLSGGETVLDIAAGTCWTSRELADRGCTVFAGDIRTIKYTGLRSAEAYFEAGSRHFHRLCWDLGPIPFRDQTFDLVVCNNAFQYVENLAEVFNEIHRVLKPNGKFVLTWTGASAPLKSKNRGPGYRRSKYRGEAQRAGFEDIDCWTPESLFNVSGLVRTRDLNSLQKVVALVFDAVWILFAPFRPWLMGRPMLAVAKLVGLPFNLICRRGV